MSKIIKRLIVLVFILNYGVAQDIQSRMTMELLNAYENGGKDVKPSRRPNGDKKGLHYIDDQISFKDDSTWVLKDARVIGSMLPATLLLSGKMSNGVYILVTYLVRNDSRKSDRIYASPALMDDSSNKYEAVDMQNVYLKELMYDSPIELAQLTPGVVNKFSAIYEVPDTNRVLMFLAREISSIAPNSTKICIIPNPNNPVKDSVGVAQPPLDVTVLALKKKADTGDADAQNSLGLRYDYGYGVTQDRAEAVKWYRIAADHGDPHSQANLGSMYSKGEGVAKDLVQAHVWFNVAGANGNVKAKENLAIIEQQMTDPQKAKAMDLARELFAKLPKGN